MKKEQEKKKRVPKIGDRVWVKLPMNATITHIFKNGSFRLETDDKTSWERHNLDEECELI